MSYRLTLDTPIPDALRAAALEQLRDAAGQLREEHDDDPVEAVHEARKDLKKTRSLLRLARPGMAAKAYRRENDALRDIGRSLSGRRDADVLVETLDGLSETLLGRLPEQSIALLRQRLIDAAAASALRQPGSIETDAAAALEAAAARAEKWRLDDCDRATVRAGARRAYKRGRQALAVAEREPSVEHLHEWRKRVKDLWYHQRLLAPTWPGVVKAQAKETHRLSELLGDDHDLAVLAETLLAGSGPMADTPADEDPVLEVIAQRRAELQHDARRLAARIYAETPKAYGRRLSRYLKAAQTDGQVAQPA